MNWNKQYPYIPVSALKRNEVASKDLALYKRLANQLFNTPLKAYSVMRKEAYPRPFGKFQRALGVGFQATMREIIDSAPSTNAIDHCMHELGMLWRLREMYEEAVSARTIQAAYRGKRTRDVLSDPHDPRGQDYLRRKFARLADANGRLWSNEL